jgi:hypothetical protein
MHLDLVSDDGGLCKSVYFMNTTLSTGTPGAKQTVKGCLQVCPVRFGSPGVCRVVEWKEIERKIVSSILSIFMLNSRVPPTLSCMFSYIPSLHPITGHDSSENDLEDIFETGTRGLKTGGGSLCLRNSKRRISVFWKLGLPEIDVMEKGSIEQAISRFRTKVLRGTCNTCGNPMYIQKSISQRPEMLMLQLNRQDDQGNKLDDEIPSLKIW